VRVYAGVDPFTGKRHYLTEVSSHWASGAGGGVGANPEHTSQQHLSHPETHEHERARRAVRNDTRRQQLRRHIALDTEVPASATAE
jgi:hypothetical protein